MLFRQLRYEPLEDRRLLSVGDLLLSLVDPSSSSQKDSSYGQAVATGDAYTVVGAPGADVQGNGDTGRVYVFDRTTNELVATIENPEPGGLDNFGFSVAISGSTVVVGAWCDDAGFLDSGTAYVFDAPTGNLLLTLANPTPAAYDHFGTSVAISGNTIVVGAGGDDANGTDSGTAYVFDATTGGLLWTLLNPTPASYDSFGNAVAVSGNVIVVGAYADDTTGGDSGSAYVFDAGTGNLLRTLANPTPGGTDNFGVSVAVSGNTAVVAAYRDDTGATDSGTAYVFNTMTGALTYTLLNPTPEANDYFGVSVAISGTTIAVGSHCDDTGATDSGSVYLFGATTGNLLRTLANPTPAAGDGFGISVAVSGGKVAVGAYGDDAGAVDAGAAYLFDASTGGLLFTMANPTPASYDDFGGSVALSGNTAVVGAYGDSSAAGSAGSAYVLDVATGNRLWTLANPSPESEDNFGWSVAVSGNKALVGAPQDDTGAANSGSAYVFNTSTGELLWTLDNPSPVTNDYFGYSVAISGNVAVVGAYGDNTDAPYSGRAYVFNAATGELLWTLANPTPASYEAFGKAVAISGNTIVVGAPCDDAGNTDSGAAYVFDAATGKQLRTLVNPTAAFFGNFGSSAAISGDTVVIGAVNDGSGMYAVGAAYVFNATTGNLLTTLANPTPAESDYFGYSVAVTENIVAVGAYYDDAGGNNSGTAYLFDATTGNLLCTLANPTPGNYEVFGNSVAASGRKAIVGTPWDDGSTSDRGAAYVFDLACAPTDLGLSGVSVDEDLPSGATVGSLSTTDANLPYDSHTYALVDGEGSADNAQFTIVGDQLKTAASLDYETKTSCSIRLRTTDSNGLSFQKVVTIAINDVNLAPTDLAMSNLSVAENQPSGTVVGNLSSTDAESPAGPFTYDLVAGTGDTDNARFTIVGNQLKTTASFDYETKTSYAIRVRTTDAGGLSFEKAFAISVTDVNLAPTDLALSHASVAENLASGAIVGTLSSTDLEPPAAPFTYTLVTGTGSDNNASFTIVGTQLKTAASFDFETKSTYTIRVRTTDAGGLWFEKAFTINVTDVDDFDRIAVGFGGSNGTWFWKAPGTWTPLHGSTPVWIVSGDLDGNGKADLVVNFGGTTGIWIYHDTGTWQYLHPATSTTAAMADIDGDNRAELILTTSQAGIAGVWTYDATQNTWAGLSGWQAESFAVGDFDGNGKQDVAVDFGAGKGVWFWNNNTAWQYVHNVNPGWMAAGDLDGNGKTDLAVSVTGANDIWARLDSGAWQYIKSMANSTASAADSNGDGRAELFVSITDPAYAGLWEYAMPASSWKYTTDWRPERLTSADVDGNGKKDVVADFGTKGLWVYKNDATWQRIHTLDAQVMSGTRFGQALMADAAVALVGQASLLTYADLAPIVAEAMRRLALSTDATFEIADLPEGILGEAIGNRILIDRDAAGFGWFVDQTPTDDLEYRTGNRAAAEHMDLLTAVMHELGHTFGLSDFDSSIESLMNGWLKVGLRRVSNT